MQRLNEGLAAIPKADLERLEAKWVINPTDRYYVRSSSKIELTPKEEAWLHAHPRVSIAVMDAWPPVSRVNKQGEIEGIDCDLLALLGERIGIEFDIKAMPFHDGIGLVRDKKLDSLMDVTPKPEREAFLNFTKPYLEIPHVIVARESGDYYQSEEALKGRTVALEKGFFSVKYFKEKYSDIRILELPDTAACLEAVAVGKADAYIGNRAVAMYVIARDLLVGLEIQGKSKRKGSVLAIGTRKDWPELASILDKALASVGAKQKQSILTQWSSTASKQSGVNLTPEERAWINQHPTLQIAATPDWPPFEFKDNGNYVGVSADILKLVAERVGLKISPQFGAWSTLMAKMESGGLDLSPGMVKTPERTRKFVFTHSYIGSPVGIWVESSRKDIQGMEDLKGKTVAVEEGYSTHEAVKRLHPEIKLHLVKSPIEAILSVSGGQADAYLGNQSATLYLMNKNMIANMKVAGFFKESSLDLRFGIRKDRPILAVIMNKALATVSIAEKNDLLAKYVGKALSAESSRTLALSDEEKQWIAEHPQIRLGVDPALPPFEYFQGVTFNG